jgi:hypothetical protein
MLHVNVRSRRFLIGLAVSCGAALPAQELAPVKDLPYTIGSASKTRGPLLFCAIPDASIIPAAYDAAAKGGKRPFVIGWELKADPPRELAKIVLITSLPQAGNLARAN